MKHRLLFFSLLWILSIMFFSSPMSAGKKPAFGSTLSSTTKTVGVGGDYTTLDQAFNFISTHPFTDSLTLLLTDHTYHEPELYLTGNTNQNIALTIRPVSLTDTPLVIIAQTDPDSVYAWHITNFRNISVENVSFYIDPVSVGMTGIGASGNCGNLLFDNVKVFADNTNDLTNAMSIIDNDSTASTISLTHCYIRTKDTLSCALYVGSYPKNCILSITNSTFEHNNYGMLIFYEGRSVRIDSNTILATRTVAEANIRIDDCKFTKDCSISNNTITGGWNGLYGLLEKMGSLAGNFDISRNIISAKKRPIMLQFSSLHGSINFDHNILDQPNVAIGDGFNLISSITVPVGESLYVHDNIIKGGTFDVDCGTGLTIVSGNSVTDTTGIQLLGGQGIIAAGISGSMHVNNNHVMGYHEGMHIVGNQLIAQNNTCDSNSIGFVLLGAGVYFSKNNASNNFEVGVQTGVTNSDTSSSFLMNGNTITNNGIDGIRHRWGALTVNNNILYGNSSFDIQNENSVSIDARYNWWGTTTTPVMNTLPYPSDISKIFDVFDNSANGFVDYLGWLQDSSDVDTSTTLGSISGKVFIDDNADCTQDPTELNASRRIVHLLPTAFYPAGLYSTTNNSGGYVFSPLVPGSYTIELLPGTGYWEQTCPASNGTLSATIDSNETEMNVIFGTRRIPGIHDLRIGVWNYGIRPGFTQRCGAYFENKGTVQMDGTISIVLPPNTHFVSGSATPVNSGYDNLTRTITWYLPGLAPDSNGSVSYDLQADAPPSLNVGDTIQFCATIEPIASDFASGDNSSCVSTVVRGSFDPNDKQVTPVGSGVTGDVAPGTKFTYQIRFQNTGTDTAFTVVVKDTLDSHLEISTLQVAASSHPFTYSVTGNGVLTFLFSNILLPDSNVNEPASHGLISFSIFPVVDAPDNTVINNTAAIYFDFNTPVITNTVTNRLLPPSMTMSVTNKWNLLSLPLQPENSQVSAIFPAATSQAFAFEGSYTSKSTLTPGTGYWLKFGSARTIGLIGSLISNDSIHVNTGWNLIGSISQPVSVVSITSNPPGLVTSEFFGYANGYTSTPTIEPGKGYWVKVDQAGTLILSSVLSKTSGQGTIKIVASNELPPPPPGELVSSSEAQTPTQFALEQNYPNPFNPSTMIRYQLPSNSFVTLKIYDMLGREVSTLVDGMQDAGYKSVEFNASNLPSGIYIYSLSAGTFSEVKKMLMIK